MESCQPVESVLLLRMDEFVKVTELEAPKELDIKHEGKTCWRSVYLAGIVAFFAAVENTVVGMGEWPYMHTIDPAATSAFFGAASSASKCGRIVFSLLFSFWTYKTHKIRPTLITGRILAFIGCCLYLCVEFLPSTDRRFLMMFCYVIFGIASSSSAVLRVYLVAVSAVEDRSKAFAAIAVANMMSIVIGPLCQLAFSGISYPGLSIFPNVMFHLYSAPVWVAAALNFISLGVIIFMLEEKLTPPVKEIDDDEGLSWDRFMEKLRKLRATDVCWALVVVCCMEKFIVSLTPATLMTIGGPMKMVIFGWDGTQTVRWTSLFLSMCGLLAIGVAFLFMKTSIGKKIPPSASFLFAISISLFLYVGSYPVETWGGPIPEYNATSGAGCNPLEYSWCDTATKTQPYIYFPVMILTLGLAIPVLHIALDTVYSRVLGNIDQSIMQGVIVAVDDFVMIVGPLYSSTLFTVGGLGPLWFSNGVVTVIGIIIWIIFIEKLKKFN